MVFFAFVGFEGGATRAGEAKEPGRAMPRAILGSLGLSASVYCLVAFALVGAVRWDKVSRRRAPPWPELSHLPNRRASLCSGLRGRAPPRRHPAHRAVGGGGGRGAGGREHLSIA